MSLERALALHGARRWDEAEAEFRRLVQAGAVTPALQHAFARLYYDTRRFTEALPLAVAAARAAPGEPAFATLHARILLHLDRAAEALAELAPAAQRHPADGALAFHHGRALRALGHDAEAADAFRRALTQLPDYAPAHNNLGNALFALGECSAAETHLARAAALDPKLAEPLANLAQLKHARGDLDGAQADAESALARAPRHPRAHQVLAALCLRRNEGEAARAHLAQARAARPDDPELQLDEARLAAAAGDSLGALRLLRELVRHTPAHYGARLTLAGLLRDLGYAPLALKQARCAVALEPQRADSQFMLAQLLEQNGEIAEAIPHYARGRSARDSAAVRVQHAHARLKIADWSNHAQMCAEARAALEEMLARDDPHEAVPAPLSLPLLDLPAALRRGVAQRYAAQRARQARLLAPVRRAPRAERSRLRIGYLSPDLREHPVGWLMQDVFAAHDRAQVEVHAYALTPSTDATAQRIRQACDVWHSGYGVPSAALAQQIADDGIDVLIDLGGYTTHTRPEVLALKPAPVQGHFLGYPGTLGAEAVPAILADRWLIPPELRGEYTESVVQLSQGFIGSAMPLAHPAPERSALGLPERGFVYACFNAVYKFSPDLFSIWMDALRAVPGSVLWLADAPAITQRNLRAAAAAQDVAPERLVFARRLPQPDYLAALSCADFFLDSFRYGAGSTAVCALAAGLPMLSWAGDSFASRMGASVLAAAGLESLACATPAEYATRAIHLAGAGRAELETARAQLRQHGRATPLFDVGGFARQLERAFAGLWNRRESGLEDFSA